MKPDNRKTRKTNRRIRLIILIAILVFSTVIGLLHQYAVTAKPVGVDALCPFGGIESLITLIASGTMLRRIAVSSFILLIATVIIAVVYRRSFCGNICPFGALQELFGKLGKKIFRKKITMHSGIDKYARYFKYFLLAAIVFLSFRLGDLIIRPYDPWAAFHHLTSGELFVEFLFGFIILMISVTGSMIYDRFFCKYLCPMGAFLGIVSKIGLFKIKRESSSCTSCGACDRACPVNIKVSSMDTVKSAECLNCNECVNVCPVEDTLKIEGPKKQKISPKIMTLVTLLILAAVVGFTTLSGSFQWGMNSLASEISIAGHFDAEMIKGSMSFEEVVNASGISKALFMEEFKFMESEFTVPIKSVKGKYGFDMEQVREFIMEQIE